MSETREAIIRVNMVHGGELEFVIERSEEELRNTGTNIEKSMKANYIGVELDNRLTLIPAHNIASLAELGRLLGGESQLTARTAA